MPSLPARPPGPTLHLGPREPHLALLTHAPRTLQATVLPQVTALKLTWRRACPELREGSPWQRGGCQASPQLSTSRQRLLRGASSSGGSKSRDITSTSQGILWCLVLVPGPLPVHGDKNNSQIKGLKITHRH